LVIEECTYQGDCLGTCPKCEAEVRYLERELEKRQRLGKAAIFAGMTIGTAITAAGCGPLAPTPNGMMENPRDTIVAADTISNDSVEEPVLLEGDVMAPVPDSLEEEEWDTEGFVEPNFDEAVEDEDRPGVYMIVEQMPEFPGGDKSLFQFIADNTKYPADAKEKGIKGRVFVNFIVEPDGSVFDIRVLRGIGGGCDEESVRVVKSMPKFKPGMQNGEAVRVSYTVPVIFRLEDN
jgi:TonB family protein